MCVAPASRRDSFFDVVVMGAGYAGLMTALRLAWRGRPMRVALISTHDEFGERIRLQESIVAPVAPRIPSIASFVAGTGIEFILGKVVSLDAGGCRVRVASGSGDREIAFDRAVYALGSDIDTGSIPGVAEHTFRLSPGGGPRTRLRCGRG